jgi:hypothetical protein
VGAIVEAEEAMTFDGTEESARAIAKWLPKNYEVQIRPGSNWEVIFVLDNSAMVQRWVTPGCSIIKKTDGSTRFVKLQNL